MNKIIVTLFISFMCMQTMAQNNEYTEMALEVDQEIWNDKDPIFTSNELPVAFKNESAVILARKQVIETNTERKGKSLLYIGKMHSTIKKTIRERIFINDQVSLDKYSEINFDQLQSKQNGAITKLRTYTFMGIRVTKPGGDVQKITVDEAAVKLEETKAGVKNKIAVPNLAIGDVLDYYITYFDQARTDKDVDYFSFIFGDEYPIVNLSIRVLLDKRVAAQYQCINGAPDFKKSLQDDDNLMELTASNLTKYSNVLWTSPNRQVPIVRIKYAFADIRHSRLRNDFTRTGVVEKVNSPQDIENTIATEIGKLLTTIPLDPDVKKKWKKYATEHNIDKNNADSIVSFVYYYYRFYNFGNYRRLKEDYSSSSYFLGDYGQLVAGLSIMRVLDKDFDIDADVLLLTGKNSVGNKDLFSPGDLNFLFRVPFAKPVYLYLGNSLYNYGEVPPAFEEEEFRIINYRSINTADGGIKQKIAEKTNGTATVFRTQASDNSQTENLEINIEKSNPQLLNIQRKVVTTGHLRRDLQAAALLMEEYMIAERKALNIEKDMEATWKSWGKTYRESWEEAKVLLDKARVAHKEKIESELTEQYVDKPKELKSYTILQNGLRGSKAEMEMEEAFTMDGWVKKAGNNYIVEAGKFAGVQLEIKADQRERKLDVYMPFTRSYNNNIVFNIPDGYAVEGLEKLNKSVKNECGGFESSAKLEGNKLVITVKKYYSNILEPASNWSKITAFVDEGFAFTKEKILLKKKS